MAKDLAMRVVQPTQETEYRNREDNKRDGVRCRVCEYFEFVGMYEREVESLRKRKYYFKLAMRRKVDLETMHLRPSKMTKMFCNEEHYLIARDWQRDAKAVNSVLIEDVQESINNGILDVNEALEMLNSCITIHLTEPRHSDIVKCKEILRRARMTLARRRRTLREIERRREDVKNI